MAEEKDKVSKAKVTELLEGSPSQGYAEIRLANPKRTGTITVRDYWVEGENEGDRYHRPYVDANGEYRVTRYNRKKLLNLSNKNDRLEYLQVMLHPIYSKVPKPILLVVNHQTEAEVYVVKKDMEAEVNGIVKGLSGMELRDFARILLIPIRTGSSDEVLKRAVYQKAEETPELVLNEWNDEDKELKALIRLGIEKQAIKVQNGMYLFGNNRLGTNFAQALDWVRENEDLLPSMRKSIKGG